MPYQHAFWIELLSQMQTFLEFRDNSKEICTYKICDKIVRIGFLFFPLSSSGIHNKYIRSGVGAHPSFSHSVISIFSFLRDSCFARFSHHKSQPDLSDYKVSQHL